VAGNHDIDTQDGELLDTLRTAYPGLAVPLDFLVIEPAAGDTSAGPVVVAHGHHFDRQCTPLYARRLGETFSETLAWAFQGADRIWSWSGDNDVTEWAGGAPFRANLVSDDPAVWKGLDEVLLGAAMLASAGATLGVPMAAAVAAAGGDALVTRQLEDPALWESLFKHKISWEYFERPSAAENVFEEVLCGKEWFKFRHLDELFVSDGMRGLFPSQPGRLVLGHSHEPRHSALRGAGEPVLEYLNSGAAGRFENLLWCVEVVDGAAQVAAWHRPGGPRSADAPVRYVYQPTSRGADQLLSPTAIPLSVAALAPGVRWLEAVLHVAMR
jgi:hypothetical protein